MKSFITIISTFIFTLLISCSEDDSFDQYSFNVKATIADHSTHPKIDYELEIVAKDAPLGNLQWSKKMSLSKTDEIIIPNKFNHYTFIASKPGYIPHVQHFISQELNNHQLSFEFIPESLDGFITYKSDDEKVIIYFPDDENRCKLYARFDVAEGCNILYFHTGKSSYDREYENLSEPLVKEFLPAKNSASPSRLNVNLFNNVPYAEALDYCNEIDLTISPIAPEIEDVNIGSFTKLDYLNMDNGRIKIITPYHIWIGLNNQ